MEGAVWACQDGVGIEREVARETRERAARSWAVWVMVRGEGASRESATGARVGRTARWLSGMRVGLNGGVRTEGAPGSAR